MLKFFFFIFTMLAAIPSFAEIDFGADRLLYSKANKIIWVGKAGEYNYLWKFSGIEIHKNASIIKNISLPYNGSIDSEFISDANEYYTKTKFSYNISKSYTILSVVGPILSYKAYFYCDCGGTQPGHYRNFFAVKRGKPVKLTDLFPENDIYAALMDNGVVSRSPFRKKDPTELSELLEVLDNLTGSYSYFNLMEHFAFHHINGNKVAVILGLAANVGVLRGSMEEIEIYLTIPKALKKSLTLASKKKEGFLMKDAEEIANGKESCVELDYPVKKEYTFCNFSYKVDNQSKSKDQSN